jgi:hypothetical protein
MQVPGLNSAYGHATATVIAVTISDGRIEASELGGIAVAIAIDLDRAEKAGVSTDEALQIFPSQMQFLLEHARIAPGHETSLATFATRLQEIAQAGATPHAFLALAQELLPQNGARAGYSAHAPQYAQRASAHCAAPVLGAAPALAHGGPERSVCC